jgi:TRAP-type uncharacterized transport system substrate-binding protein
VVDVTLPVQSPVQSEQVPPYYHDSLKFVSGFTGSYRMSGAIGRILNMRHGYPITMFVNRSMRDPDLLASGVVDFHWFIPRYTARWAMMGIAEFEGKPAPNVRAIARFPQNDLMLFAVAPHCDVESLREIPERRLPMKIGLRGAQYFTYQVFREYGFSVQDVEDWGGHVYRDREELGTSTDVGRWCIEQGLDAVFGEAITQSIWGPLAADGWRFLPLDENVLDQLGQRLHIPRAMTPVGLFPSITRKLPTIDQSDFLLTCRAELPEELIHLVTRVIDENSQFIERATAGVDVQYSQPLPVPEIQIRSPLTGPIARQWEGSSIPLHPGAERYYRETGRIT